MIVFWLALWAAPVFAMDNPELLAPVIVREEAPPGRPSSIPSEFSGTTVPMDARGESSLVRVLSRRASVFVVRSGSDEGHALIQLRGQDPQQTRFFLQGIPLTDAQFQSAQVGWFPTEALQSVELFPEGAPASLGADGLGGAIALRLTPPLAQGGMIGTRLGSFGARRIFARATGLKPLPFSVFVDVSETTEDFSYRDSNSTPLIPGDDRILQRRHNAQRSISLLPHFTLWRSTHSQGEVFGFHSLRRNEIPGAVGLTLQGELDTRYHLMVARAQGSGGEWEWESALHGWLLDQRLASAEEMNALQVQSSSSYSVGGHFLVRRTLGDVAWDVNAAANLDRALLSTVDAQTPAGRWVLPLSASARWGDVKGWALKPAVLFQMVGYSGEVSRQDMFASPRVGVEWNSPLHRLRVVGGRYHRSPSLSEIYGSPAAVTANPGLRAEHSWKIEGGYDGRWPLRQGILRDLQASATLSASFADDLIALVPNSQLTFRAQNVGRSRIFTPEFGAEAGLGKEFVLRLNSAALFTENLSPAPAYFGRPLPMRPAYRGGLEAEWERGGWRVTYSLQATGPFYADAAGGSRVGEYWEHSVWTSLRSRNWGSLLVELRNLTDATTVGGQEWGFGLAQNTTGLTGFPAPGRRVYVTWRYDI